MVRFIIKKLYFYKVMNALNLWGLYIRMLKFARRSFFFGYALAVFTGAVAIGMFMTIMIPFDWLREIGVMPNWLYFVVSMASLIPFGWFLCLAAELFYAGLRAPNQFLLGNLFWSDRHEKRWTDYLAWLESERDSKLQA